jgi:hypothetical protein
LPSKEAKVRVVKYAMFPVSPFALNYQRPENRNVPHVGDRDKHMTVTRQPGSGAYQNTLRIDKVLEDIGENDETIRFGVFAPCFDGADEDVVVS